MNRNIVFSQYGRVGIMLLFLMASLLTRAQTYDLLIKGGHVLDPANHIDGIMDLSLIHISEPTRPY